MFGSGALGISQTMAGIELDVVHRNEDLLVVHKPAGLLAQADHTGDPDVFSLVKKRLRGEREEAPFLGLVHRLDRPTSGLMVLACSREAARHLSRQFRERHVEKRYLAIVEGTCDDFGRAVDYLRKEEGTVYVVDAGTDGARRAVLTWRTLARRDGLSLLDVELETGRSHQVRVQLAHRDAPIWGDTRYGAQRPFEHGGIALHAYLLGVEHPSEGRIRRWTAAPHWDEHFAREIEALL